MALTDEGAPQPPSPVQRALPPREGFIVADEQGREDLARARRERILVIDTAGRVLSYYGGGEEPELDALMRRITPDHHLAGALQQSMLDDALWTARSVLDSGTPQWRDYSLLQDDGTRLWYEFDFESFPLFAARAETVIFVRSSRYVGDGKAYRPYVYRYGHYAAFLHSEFWTNGTGYRDEEVVLPKPANCFRIACIGGSTTMEGPRNDLTYPNLLEKRLRERFGQSGVEVINCGVDGNDFEGERTHFREYLALQPDLIVHYNFVNNAWWVFTAGMKNKIAREQVFGPVQRLLGKSVFVNRFLRDWLTPLDEDYSAPLEKEVISKLREMAALARDAGVRFAVCSFDYPDPALLSAREEAFYDSLFSYPPWGRIGLRTYAALVDTYNRRVRELCKEEELLYLPVEEQLRGGFEVFTDICHMHLGGIDRKAEVMAALLEPVVAAAVDPR